MRLKNRFSNPETPMSQSKCALLWFTIKFTNQLHSKLSQNKIINLQTKNKQEILLNKIFLSQEKNEIPPKQPMRIPLNPGILDCDSEKSQI